MDYLSQIDRTGNFTNIRPLILNEYGALIHALSSDKYQIVDLVRESKLGGKGKFNPVTFAEFTVVGGEKKPVEPFLHNDEDVSSGQSLDYIFELKVHGHKPIKTVLVHKTKVEKFKILSSKYEFLHTSDHYGISTVIL